MNKTRIAIIGSGKTEIEMLRILDRDDIEIVDISDVNPEDMMVHTLTAREPFIPEVEDLTYYPSLNKVQKNMHVRKLGQCSNSKNNFKLNQYKKRS